MADILGALRRLWVNAIKKKTQSIVEKLGPNQVYFSSYKLSRPPILVINTSLLIMIVYTTYQRRKKNQKYQFFCR